MGYPQVQKDQVRGFAKAWDHNGIKMLLDDVSLQFAVDFANVVLRSFVDDMAKRAMAAKQKAQALNPVIPAVNAVAGSQPQPTIPAPAPEPSRIILATS